MELRNQEKEIGMPSSLGYNPPNRDSSTKIPPSSIISAPGERKRGHQTVEHHPLYHQYHHHHQHQVNLQHQSLKPSRDPELVIPDPTSAPAPAPAPIAATSSATNIAPASSGRSLSRSPPPPPAAVSTTILTAASSTSVRYTECLKNHAASLGGLVVDGCGEFMPSGQEGTPEALKCAACECHRNFHRKEIDGEPQFATTANCYYKSNNQTNTLPHPQQLATSLYPPQPPVQQHHKYPHGFSMSASTAATAPIMMAFGGGGGGGAPAESSSEDLNMFQANLHGQGLSVQPSLLKKRFRTKFSQEQKDKMMEFAEKLEWRIQKQAEQEVQQFCSKVGVKRKVFKVWMHNNKQAMKKKQM